MYISEEQQMQLVENGVLLIPNYFSPEEVGLMREQLPGLFHEDGPQRVLETNGAVRSVYAIHRSNQLFAALVRHPRLLLPAMDILSSQVYVYQSKINVKSAMGGDVWQWHQDFIFWHEDDGLPSDRIINMSIFLDEVTEFNGPVMFIPRSHKTGMVEMTACRQLNNDPGSESWKTTVAADLKYALDRAVVAKLASRFGIITPKGLPGSLLMFHPNIFHASTNNMSTSDRNLLMVTYNSIDNLPLSTRPPRPDFLTARDYRPLEPLPEECLMNTPHLSTNSV
jgi:hypothetical protein